MTAELTAPALEWEQRGRGYWESKESKGDGESECGRFTVMYSDATEQFVVVDCEGGLIRRFDALDDAQAWCEGRAEAC
jgi:hypothetical protein